MNKQDIEKYLRMVGLELQKQGTTSEMLLLGGAVMLIEVGNRGTHYSGTCRRRGGGKPTRKPQPSKRLGQVSL